LTEPSEEPQARAASPSQASLPVGRVGRAHGLDGSFYVTRPRAQLLVLGAEVTVAQRTAAIVRRSGTEQRPIVRLEGVSDREAAEALRGAQLTVAQSAAPALGEGEWWAHELEGCVVVDGERPLGTVKRLIELPSCEALEVDPAAGGEPVLVPLVKDAVRSVLPAQRRIDVNLDFLGLAPEPPPGGERGAEGEPGAGAEQGERP
jgi:16S rRNA processing protein RimM